MRVKLGQIVLACLAVAACDSEVTVTETPLERVVIHDLDGKEWDVTQAVYRYGFEEDGFQFGFGLSSGQPLILPPTASEGEKGFPAPGDTFDLVGVVLGGEPRAYGLDDLKGFLVADDVVGARAIAVVVEPLLGTASVYDRTTHGVVLVLGYSGWAYDDGIILYDIGTESLWYRLPSAEGLTCINGEYLGFVLVPVESTRTRWNLWYAAHPDTRVVVIPPQP